MIPTPTEWSQADLAFIAAIALVVSAAVTAIATAIAAHITARSSRLIAGEAARREFRLKGVQPYLEYLDRRLFQFQELAELGPELVASLENALAIMKTDEEKGKEELHKSAQRLDQVKTELIDSKRMFYETGFFALAFLDQLMLDRSVEWLRKDYTFLQTTVVGKMTVTPENLRRVNGARQDAWKSAVRLRVAIDTFIFGNRGAIRRGAYWCWSKAKDLWDKVARPTKSRLDG